MLLLLKCSIYTSKKWFGESYNAQSIPVVRDNWNNVRENLSCKVAKIMVLNVVYG